MSAPAFKPIWFKCPACHERAGVPLAVQVGHESRRFKCAQCGCVWTVPIVSTAGARIATR